jgi:hypothetical protein
MWNKYFKIMPIHSNDATALDPSDVVKESPRQAAGGTGNDNGRSHRARAIANAPAARSIAADAEA